VCVCDAARTGDVVWSPEQEAIMIGAFRLMTTRTGDVVMCPAQEAIVIGAFRLMTTRTGDVVWVSSAREAKKK